MRTFTLAEAARFVGTSRGTLYRLIKSGRLVCTSAGGPGKTSTITEDELRQAGFQVPPEVEHLGRVPDIQRTSPTTSYDTSQETFRLQVLEQRVEHLERYIARLEREINLVFDLFKSGVGQHESASAPPMSTPAPSVPARSEARPLTGLRQQIVTLLRQHPDGLSPTQVREALKLEKDMADTLRHMARDGILKRIETGRYVVAEGW
jgi:excisionase family DNA binding protein